MGQLQAAQGGQCQDLLWCWTILCSSGNIKNLYKAESGELLRGQALVTTRGFLLGAEKTPTNSSTPEDALRSCVLLEVTETQVL